MRQATENSLLSKWSEVTVYGVLLVTMQWLFYGYLTGQNVMVVVCFLAAVAVVKMMWPSELMRRYMWWQMFSVVMCCAFGWWLIYTAENTRVGWYRFHVLKGRVDSFVQHAPAYVVMGDSDGHITATSENIGQLTGYAPGELVGKPLTVLMRDGPAAKHLVAYERAVTALRSPHSADQGWMLQGLITVGVRRKDGTLVPVKAYAGGVRWSTDIQFEGDIDLFAVFIPIDGADASKGLSNIHKSDMPDVRTAPKPMPN